MILEDKADFLFSPYSSGLTATAAVVTEQNEKIMLTTGAAEEKTYKLGNQYLFQMFAPATQYLTAALDALKTKDPKATVAFVYEDSSFSVAVVTPAKAYAQQQGFNVVFSEAYAPNTTDFSAIIDKVIASKATVLLGGGHYADGSTLARQLYGHKVPLKMITLLVAPDSPQWSRTGRCGGGRNRAVAVGTTDRPSRRNTARAAPILPNHIPRSTTLRPVMNRLEATLRIGFATSHRTGGWNRNGESGAGAECDRYHDVLRPDEVFHAGQRARVADGPHNFSGAVAEGQVRQAGETGGMAAGGQERRFDVPDPLSCS